jgi:hypothetical protein
MKDYFEELKNNVDFDKELHEYTMQGKKYTSATTLLKIMGITKDFERISSLPVVEDARNRGLKIHDEISFSIGSIIPGKKFFMNPESPEAKAFIYSICWERLQEWYPEQILADTENLIAGRADLIYRYNNDGDVVIIDIKTAKNVDLWEAAWQLELYKHMLRPIYDGPVVLQVAVFSEDGYVCTLKDVSDYIPEAEVNNLLEAYRNGLPYDQGRVVVLQDTRQYAIDAMKLNATIAHLKAEIENKEIVMTELRRKLYESLDKHNIKTVDIDGCKITRIDPGFRKVVDNKRLKEDYPDIYNQYTKLTETKATVRFTFNEKETEK